MISILCLVEQVTREAYDYSVIKELSWIRREHNLADALTKIKINEAMRNIMNMGIVHYESEQFFVRKPTSVNDYNLIRN